MGYSISNKNQQVYFNECLDWLTFKRFKSLIPEANEPNLRIGEVIEAESALLIEFEGYLPYNSLSRPNKLEALINPLDYRIRKTNIEKNLEIFKGVVGEEFLDNRAKFFQELNVTDFNAKNLVD